MNEAGTILRKEIERRRAAKAQVAAQLEGLDNEIQHLEYALRVLADGASVTALRTPLPNKSTLPDAIKIVLREAGRALDGKEVVEELHARGLKAKGPSVYSALSRLTAEERLMKVGRGRYTIAIKAELDTHGPKAITRVEDSAG